MPTPAFARQGSPPEHGRLPCPGMPLDLRNHLVFHQTSPQKHGPGSLSPSQFQHLDAQIAKYGIWRCQIHGSFNGLSNLNAGDRDGLYTIAYRDCSDCGAGSPPPFKHIEDSGQYYPTSGISVLDASPQTPSVAPSDTLLPSLPRRHEPPEAPEEAASARSSSNATISTTSSRPVSADVIVPPQYLLLRPLKELEGWRYATAMRDAERNAIPFDRRLPFGVLMNPADWASLAADTQLYDAPVCAFSEHLHRISPALLILDTQWHRILTAPSIPEAPAGYNYARVAHCLRSDKRCMEQYRYIAAPLHWANKHWTLIFADLHQKQFIHYDPLGAGYSEDSQTLHFEDGSRMISRPSTAAPPSQPAARQ